MHAYVRESIESSIILNGNTFKMLYEKLIMDQEVQQLQDKLIQLQKDNTSKDKDNDKVLKQIEEEIDGAEGCRSSI